MRRVEIVVLCEGVLDATFVRRFLKSIGWNGVIRVVPFPRGAGSQHVLESFPAELADHRRRKPRRPLIAMIDADSKSVAKRKAEFGRSRREPGTGAATVDPRAEDDAVALIVPKWSIETWLRYLSGEDFDEAQEIRPADRLNRARDCAPQAKALAEMCRRGDLREPAPDSLRDACDEWNRRLRPLMKP